MWILALDVGTSSVRAIGYDEAGRPLPGVDARTAWEPATTTDGGAELDPEALVVATASAIDRSLAAAPGPPAAVGASVFWHSLLGLDAEQRPLTGVITWADTRSARVAESLRSRLDETAVHARTGAPLHATFFPAKLTWLRETQPSLFGRAAMWCGFAEYLLLRLTGRLRASVSMASGTGLLEQSRAVWDDEMLAVCGIDPEQLPPIDDAPVSGLEPRFRARWPTLGAVPWLPGAGDGACSNLGLDCATPDRVALNVGTSAALRLVSTTPAATPWGLWHYRVDARRHLVGGATSEGGNVLAWARRTLALPVDPAELERALGSVPADGHGLTALPFLAGERSPGWRGDARAAVTGIGLSTTGPEILRALLEGVAFRLADVYERLRPLAAPEHAVIASGGALHGSRLWSQIVVDALRVPVDLRESIEASSRGAALLGLAAVGAPAPAPEQPGELLRPDPRRGEVYARARQRQARLYGSVVAPRGS
ncbi:MAG TPA: gluconokinase [Methylomirabilota bacterium]|jgi:gluconokinase|nr:gluconokinase [Methylomirabilota bacterium]